MIIIRDFFFIILAVKGFYCSDEYTHRYILDVKSPLRFTYEPLDPLNINIVLRNIPTGKTSYAIYSISGNCLPGNKTSNNKDAILLNKNQNKSRSLVPVAKTPFGLLSQQSRMLSEGNVVATGKIHVENINLPVYPCIWVYMELRSNTDLCSTIMILEGKRDLSMLEDTEFNKCQHFIKPCQIDVDLKNECQELPKLQLRCYKHATFLTCEYSYANLPQNTIHRWFQASNKRFSIGRIPPRNGMNESKTKFTLFFQQFDNNTELFSTMQSGDMKREIRSSKYKIILPANEYFEYNITNTIRYSELKEVEFDCQKYLNYTKYVQMGVIDPTGNNIKTYDTTKVKRKFNITHSGTKLLCLYYIIYCTVCDSGKSIHRYVDNITLLIYDESSSLHKTDNSTTYYVVASVAGVVSLLIILCCIATKKIFCKNNTEEIPQLDACTNSPFYLNLLFRKECDEAIHAQENYYEEIN